jgi:hypothetical protein
MEKKTKAEDKRARRLKQKEDAEAGIDSDEENPSGGPAEPTQEELDGLF